MTLQMRPDDQSFLLSCRRPTRPRKSPVRLVDLFSGCGGLTLGVEEAARQVGCPLEVRLAVELDQQIAEVYAANFEPVHGREPSAVTDWFDRKPGTALSSVERKTRASIGAVDVLVGGPPCTGHSTLNNHSRGTDPKNRLYLSMVRAAEVLTPQMILIENVPAITRDAHGVLAKAVRRLGALGYTVDHGVVAVVDIGVPQLRRRHVLAAHVGAAPSIEAAVQRARGPARDLRWALSDLKPAAESVGTFDTASRLSAENKKRAAHLLRSGLHDLPNDLRPECQHNEHKYKSMYGRLRWDLPAQTITTGFGSPGQGRYLHPDEIRTITPHEAARLQFFPDWFDFSALTERTRLARAIGNAVPPKLAFVLVHHLLTLDRDHR